FTELKDRSATQRCDLLSSAFMGQERSEGRRRCPLLTPRRHQPAARSIFAVSGSRFAAGNLATVGVIAGCHARDIEAEIGVAFSGSSQRCLEVRTQRTGNESKNGCINSGRLVAH